MITINETLRVPNKLEEISIAQGKEIMAILDKTKFKPNRIAKTTIISVLAKVPFAVIDKIDDKGIDEIYALFPFNKDKINGYYLDTFRLKGTLYGRINMDRLTVKEFAQILFYVNEGDTQYENIGKVLATIYRPVISKNKKLKHILKNIGWKLFFKGVSPRMYESYEIEPLNDFHDLNAELFEKHLDFQFGYTIMNGLLLNYSLDLKKNYPILFKVEEDEPEIPEETEEIEETKEGVPDFDEIWGMYHQVCSISDSLFEREAWWERPLTHLMKYLAYLKQQGAYDKRKQNG